MDELNLTLEQVRNDLRNSSHSIESDDVIEEVNVNSFQNFVSSYQRAQSFSADRSINEETELLGRRGSLSSNVTLINKNSTVYQTIFNAINTLIGIAVLSLPYALRLSGFWLGTILLFSCYLISTQTAKILGSIIKKHPELTTYGDIAGFCGGSIAQFLITLSFVVDLTGASLIIVLLFSDTFTQIFDLPKSFFKVLIVVLVFFLSFLPLNLLSLISLTGVISTFSLLLTIGICGFITNVQPGTLIHPMKINFWPQNATGVIKSLGMFMAPYGGHPVFPEYYLDMRHPYKYSYACTVSFTVTFLIDYSIAIIGFLMYGTDVNDSIIKNLMDNSNYPKFIKMVLLVVLGILPVLKLPLFVKPILRTVMSHLTLKDTLTSNILIRLVYFGFILLLSLVVQSFGRVVAFLGAAICFTLCMTFPYYCKLVVFKDDLSSKEKGLYKMGIAIGTIGAILGTVGSVID